MNSIIFIQVILYLSPHLDYKLKIGSACLEFLNPETLEWQPIESYEHQGIPLHYQIYFSD